MPMLRVYSVFNRTGGFVIHVKTVFFWVFWPCPFDSSPARLSAHTKKISKGTGGTVGVLSYHRSDEPNDHRLGDRVFALGHSLPVLCFPINVFELWALFPLVAGFFRIRFDSDISADVNFYPASHGVHISFQSRVLYLHTVVCVFPGQVVEVANRHDVVIV